MTHIMAITIRQTMYFMFLWITVVLTQPAEGQFDYRCNTCMYGVNQEKKFGDVRCVNSVQLDTVKECQLSRCVTLYGVLVRKNNTKEAYSFYYRGCESDVVFIDEWISQGACYSGKSIRILGLHRFIVGVGFYCTCAGDYCNNLSHNASQKKIKAYGLTSCFNCIYRGPEKISSDRSNCISQPWLLSTTACDHCVTIKGTEEYDNNLSTFYYRGCLETSPLREIDFAIPKTNQIICGKARSSHFSTYRAVGDVSYCTCDTTYCNMGGITINDDSENAGYMKCHSCIYRNSPEVSGHVDCIARPWNLDNTYCPHCITLMGETIDTGQYKTSGFFYYRGCADRLPATNGSKVKVDDDDKCYSADGIYINQTLGGGHFTSGYYCTCSSTDMCNSLTYEQMTSLAKDSSQPLLWPLVGSGMFLLLLLAFIITTVICRRKRCQRHLNDTGHQQGGRQTTVQGMRFNQCTTQSVPVNQCTTQIVPVNQCTPHSPLVNQCTARGLPVNQCRAHGLPVNQGTEPSLSMSPTLGYTDVQTPGVFLSATLTLGLHDVPPTYSESQQVSRSQQHPSPDHAQTAEFQAPPTYDSLFDADGKLY